MGGLLATVLIAAVACGLLTGSQTAILASLYDYPLGLLSVGVALGGAFTGLLAGAFHRRRSSRASSESATLLLAFSAPLGAAGTALAFTDRGKQIHHPHGIFSGVGFQIDSLHRIKRGEIIEQHIFPFFLRAFEIYCLNP